MHPQATVYPNSKKNHFFLLKKLNIKLTNKINSEGWCTQKHGENIIYFNLEEKR